MVNARNLPTVPIDERSKRYGRLKSPIGLNSKEKVLRIHSHKRLHLRQEQKATGAGLVSQRDRKRRQMSVIIDIKLGWSVSWTVEQPGS
jgi:hypothetical protein